MTALGTSLIVLGSAFVLSGMIFVTSDGRKRSAKETREESQQEETGGSLQQVREERGEL
jgi:hypothetical protein